MKSFGVYFSGGATTVMSVLQLRADRLLDFGDGKGFAGHLVETFGRYEKFAAQHGAKLPRVHLRHHNLLEAAQQVAEVARQRPDMAQVDVRYRIPVRAPATDGEGDRAVCRAPADRSEEHTSELQSLMRISYAVFCL